MNEFYYLSHGGPGSGRYPLGSGDRPYQKFEGSGSGRGGIRGYIQSRKDKKANRVLQKARKEISKRIGEEKIIAEQERIAREQYEENKQRALTGGSARDVLSYQGKLTNKELTDAAERLRLERQLSGYAKDEVDTKLKKLQTTESYLKVFGDIAKDGIDLWNSFAGVYNATPDGKAKPLYLVKK